MGFKKVLGISFIAAIVCLTLFVEKSSAQMMQGFSGVPTVTPTQQDIQDIQTGKILFTKLQNKQVSCARLTDGDFEKIGEYMMNQSFGGNTNAHIQMNNAMKRMMGDQNEEQVHIRLAKNATGCNMNGQGGVTGMMGSWGWTGSMMRGNWGGVYGVFAFLFWLVSFIDLILLGIFLWKRIGRK